MIDERFTLLERRLGQLEGELDGVRARIAALEAGAGRTGRVARLVGACAIGVLATMALGTASAAPSAQPLSAAAPFKVVGKGGQTLFSVDADGARIFHGGHVAAGLVYNDGDKGATIYTADGGGHATAQIGNVGTGGAPTIRLYSSSFKPQASFDLTAHGGEVRAYDTEGHPRAVMSVLSSGGSIQAQSSGGDPVAGIYQHSDGTGLVQVFDPQGEPVGSLQSLPGSLGELAVTNGKGNVARLGTSQDGTQMTLRFLQGAKLVAGMGNSGNGGLLELFDKTGKKAVKAANSGHGGTVGIYGSDEQPKVVMATNDAGRGAFDILNDSGGPAITMTATASAGYFAIANAAGVARVEAGVLPSDQGIVRTYGPGGFDFIKGRK